MEHIVNGKTFSLLCDADSQIAETKEALFQFQKMVGQVEDQYNASQASQKIAATQQASNSSEQAPIQNAVANNAIQSESVQPKG
jgi:hypothetical protein